MGALIAAFGAGRGVASSSALFVASAQNAGNALTTGTWVVPGVTWTLHNRPTPPVGSTTAQANLSMDASPATAATLYNYDTNADSQPGRRLQKTGTGPGETVLARYANWRSPVLTTARLVNGTVSVQLWSAVASFQLNRAGSIVAYLRDYNPATNTYLEIASATRTNANWQGGRSTWVLAGIAIPVVGYTVPAGHRVELKVEATASAYTNMWIAYDTMSYASSITLP
ncbi:MAG: hypothetical protein MUE82_03625 [Chloroflexi bacterium]|jgi:hypothetical protein|nr:hypothetical protein [Chloroflexota bacterium]